MKIYKNEHDKFMNAYDQQAEISKKTTETKQVDTKWTHCESVECDLFVFRLWLILLFVQLVKLLRWNGRILCVIMFVLNFDFCHNR